MFQRKSKRMPQLDTTQKFKSCRKDSINKSSISSKKWRKPIKPKSNWLILFCRESNSVDQPIVTFAVLISTPLNRLLCFGVGPSMAHGKKITDHVNGQSMRNDCHLLNDPPIGCPRISTPRALIEHTYIFLLNLK